MGTTEPPFAMTGNVPLTPRKVTDTVFVPDPKTTAAEHALRRERGVDFEIPAGEDGKGSGIGASRETHKHTKGKQNQRAADSA
jgi:hypothetical protein